MQNAPIPIVVVGFRNSSDIVQCLSALAKARREPSFAIYICENGGQQAYDKLTAALTAAGGPCPGIPVVAPPPGPGFLRACRLKLAQETGSAIDVTIGEARGILGFAGGINSWLAPLLQ